MGNYPDNYKSGDLGDEINALEANLEKAGQLLDLISNAFGELTTTMQEVSTFVQPSTAEYSRSRIGMAQAQMKTALGSAREALAVIEEQKRDAERMTENIVYGMPPADTTVYGLPRFWM